MPKRCYLVSWKNGVPYIQAGEYVEVGKKKKQRRAKINGLTALIELSKVSDSMKDAIAKEIDECAHEYSSSTSYYQRKAAKPWVLVRAITKLWRLYKKLKRRNLVD